jgi:transposase
MTNKAVAELEHLHEGTVKDLDKVYMRRQLARAGTPAPRVIGVDEIAIRKGHDYRIVVSDLERGRPIWVGGEGRSEADLDLFFKDMGERRTKRVELVAMDMWRPFRNSVMKNVPQARIVFDKFHIMRHLADALDEVRRSEYRRLVGKDRSYIKGQRYTLLSHRKNLTLDGRRALRKLLKANRRLNVAYMLKESFGQLWDYQTEGWARAFFERWKQALKWQRLHPYKKFVTVRRSHVRGRARARRPGGATLHASADDSASPRRGALARSGVWRR